MGLRSGAARNMPASSQTKRDRKMVLRRPAASVAFKRALVPRKGATKDPAPRCSAAELKALLPQLWRHFRCSLGKRKTQSSGTTEESVAKTADVVPHVSISETQLRALLRSQRPTYSKWASATSSDLRQAMETVARMPQLRHRLGFRFKDTSRESGTWSVTNVIGHSSSRRRGRNEDTSWDYNHVAYQLRVAPCKPSVDCSAGKAVPHELVNIGSFAVQLRRKVERKVLAARVEKRRRGQGTPLPKCKELFSVTARSQCNLAEKHPRKRIKVERKALDLLPAVIMRPLSAPGKLVKHRWTLIFLHGLGSSAFVNYGDRPHYFMDGSIELKVIVPTAPSRELSCFNQWWDKVQQRSSEGSASGSKSTKWRLHQFNSWYDYLSNHDGKREDSLCSQSLGEVQRALHSLIDREAQELGGRADRVIIGGKSQGCCTSLDAALTYPKALGGFIGLVGHVLGCTPVDPHGAQVGTPLHFFHEPEDHLMRWKWVQHGEQRLREAGYCVRSRHKKDPENHGHFIEGVEGNWIRSALRIICNNEKS